MNDKKEDKKAKAKAKETTEPEANEENHAENNGEAKAEEVCIAFDSVNETPAKWDQRYAMLKNYDTITDNLINQI